MRTLFVFLFAVFSSSLVFAGSLRDNPFYQEQIQPGYERLTDSQSLRLGAWSLVAIAGARTQDDAIRDQWGQNQKMEPRVSDYGDKFGTYAIPGFIFAGQYIWDRENSYHHLRALVAVTVLGSTLKFAVNRERPNHLDRYSFPSGHTYSAFATATSLSYAYGWKVAVIAYPLAAFVGMSRVSDDYHWFSDVVAGAALGSLVGRATYYGTLADEPKAQQRFLLLPMLSANSTGAMLLAEF